VRLHRPTESGLQTVREHIEDALLALRRAHFWASKQGLSAIAFAIDSPLHNDGAIAILQRALEELSFVKEPEDDEDDYPE
jgi:hypothetical protein